MIQNKTRQSLLDFNTELLDGVVLGNSLFNSLLDVAQSYIENLRPWVVLRAFDESQTASTSNTFTTEKDLPEDFRRWYSTRPVLLIDSQGNIARYLREIPLNLKNKYRLDNNKFYVNYGTKKLYICGTPAQNLTIQQNYIKHGDAVSDDNTWIFPGEYHNILAILVAVFHRKGIDYDVIGAQNANELTLQGRAMLQNMFEYDDELARSALSQDYGGGHFGELSGSVGNLG